jgi:hypothetical protein
MVPVLYPTEEQDVAWNLRKMGSSGVGGTREGPAPQAESKISSLPPAGEETTVSWSGKKTGRRVRHNKEDPIMHRVRIIECSVIYFQMSIAHVCKYYRCCQDIMYCDLIVILVYLFQENKSYGDKPFAFIL